MPWLFTSLVLLDHLLSLAHGLAAAVVPSVPCNAPCWTPTVAQARPGSARELQAAPWDTPPGTQTFLPLASNDTVIVNRVLDNRIPVVNSDGSLGFLGESGVIDTDGAGGYHSALQLVRNRASSVQQSGVLEGLSSAPAVQQGLVS